MHPDNNILALSCQKLIPIVFRLIYFASEDIIICNYFDKCPN